MKYLAYHYPCADGIFAAVAGYLSGEKFTYLPLSILDTEQSRIDVVAQTLQQDDELFIVDFTGGSSFIAASCARAKKVVILDHHKTGEQDLASPQLSSLSNLETHFDMKRSGATISRDYFNVSSILQTTRSNDDANRILQLFAYIEDNDLWRHSLPDSKLFSAGFQSLGLDFDARKESGSIFEKILSLQAETLIAKGREVIIEQDRIIAEELLKSFPVSILHGDAKKLDTLAVITKFPDYRSTMGNLLALKSQSQGLCAAGAVVYEEAALGDSIYKVSLRSIGDVDTTLISKHYNGGGHQNASSFNIEKVVFEQWKASS
jgi:oligoribonuclease NrnB/cAMP/cGMP phosphodiesterase (DHH superfamily)